MTGDDSLRTELEALERAAPSDAAPPHDLSTVGVGWLRPALIWVTAVSAIVAALLVTGQLPDRSTSTSPSPSAATAVEAQARNGDLILTLSSPKSVWTTAEAIDIVTTLSYVGDEDELIVRGGDGPVVFSLRQLSAGNAVFIGGQHQPCLSYPIGPQAPLVWPFAKAGGVDDEPPFDRAFFDEPRLLLPAGRWEVRALLEYGIGECDDLELEVAIEIEVVDRGPAPVPTELAEPSDGDPTRVTGILGGDANLEGGCVWLTDSAGDRWEILWPDGYAVAFRGDLPVGGGDVPVIVRGGDVVATEGDLVTVSGQRPQGVGSHCMVGIVFEATEVAVVTSEPAPSGRVCLAAIGSGILGADAEGNPLLIIEREEPFRIKWANPGADRFVTEPLLTIYNHYGEILAEEGQPIVLGGGFNEDDRVFHACGISPPLRLDPQ